MMNLVMLIDDNPQFLNLLSLMLRRKNIAMLKASSSEIAMNLINAAKVDLIVLNANMPEDSGFILCEFFRANLSTAFTPIIMLSENNSPEISQRVLSAGANICLSKRNINLQFLNAVDILLSTGYKSPTDIYVGL